MDKAKKSKIKIATERQEQLALMKWARLAKVPLVYHEHEGQRSSISGVLAKIMGKPKGYPDISLSEARAGYFGLFIELKRNRKYTTSEQNTETWLAQSDWLTHLANNHYYALRCFGWVHAKDIIEKYLSWPRTPYINLLTKTEFIS